VPTKLHLDVKSTCYKTAKVSTQVQGSCNLQDVLLDECVHLALSNTLHIYITPEATAN